MTYINGLCRIWDKYRTYKCVQDDIVDSKLLIQTTKQNFYQLFRLQLKPLLGLNEEIEAVLKENYKHQADITKTLEVLHLTETNKLFHQYESLPNESIALDINTDHHDILNDSNTIQNDEDDISSLDSYSDSDSILSSPSTILLDCNKKKKKKNPLPVTL